jgi:hypothetical protein
METTLEAKKKNTKQNKNKEKTECSHYTIINTDKST